MSPVVTFLLWLFSCGCEVEGGGGMLECVPRAACAAPCELEFVKLARNPLTEQKYEHQTQVLAT